MIKKRSAPILTHLVSLLYAETDYVFWQKLNWIPLLQFVRLVENRFERRDVYRRHTSLVHKVLFYCQKSAYLESSPWLTSSFHCLTSQCSTAQRLECGTSCAWEPFPLCLCTRAITCHTDRSFRWVLSVSCWFHGTLVWLFHQLRAHQLCITYFWDDWSSECISALISFKTLPRLHKQHHSILFRAD